MHTNPNKCAEFATETQGKAHNASVACAKRQNQSHPHSIPPTQATMTTSTNSRPPLSTPTACSPTSRPCPCLHLCLHPTISSPLAQLSEPLSAVLWLTYNSTLPSHDHHSCRPGGVCAHRVDSRTCYAHRHQYPILALFEHHNKENVLSCTVRKHVPLDCYGHLYAVRKREESADCIWVILVCKPQAFLVPSATTDSLTHTSDADLLAPVVEDAFELSLTASSCMPVTMTTILVNNVPLNKFFAMPADCERVVCPLKLTSMLGAFNIFAIVWGGSTTGQAGTIAHGIVQDIVAHVPEVDTILQKGEMLPILCSYSSSHTLSQTMK